MPRRLPKNRREMPPKRKRFSQSPYTYSLRQPRAAPVAVGEELEVTIDEMGRRGDGMARVGSYVLFIPHTKIGDRVKVRIKEVRGTFAVAEVI